MIITIDGPTASGKSSIAQKLAKKLSIYYLSTGFLYRAVSYILVREYNYQPHELTVQALLDLELFLKSGDLLYTYDSENGPQIIFKAKNITTFLKLPEVDQWASLVSTNQKLRELLNSFQHELAKSQSLVIEGRDSGTVVFPHADHKFYVTAALPIRAQRWQHLQEKQQKKFSLDESILFISERDKRDITREHAPLRCATDAHLIDNSAKNIDETLELITAYLKNNYLKK